MKIERVILDTGPLVAVLSAKDSWHGWAVKLFHGLPLPCLTCEAVLSEAFFRLRKDDKATGALCTMIDRAAFRAIPVVSMGGVARYVVQYRVDFADACLVALSENFPTATIVTTDKRDFSIMRRFGRERIPFIAPELHGSGRVNRSARHKPRMITIKGTKGQLPVTAAR